MPSPVSFTMIPKYLKIKGLYSYQKEQEIHFDPLTDASLFGIFGSVGSGKSSILEAITFALYGDTERLNRSGDDRTYNMMNLRSDELAIDFECIAGKDGQRYRFTVRGRRNSKNFKDVKTFERKGYVWEDTGWIPLAEHETTEDIIGLSYDNFRRTIIIPQGRFQEFIELRDADRTRMMKELFQLERYDLSRNVGVLSKQNDLDLSNLDGQLLALEELSAEKIEKENLRLEAVRERLVQELQALQVLVSEEAALQKRKAAFERISLLQKELGDLDERKVSVEEREKSLALFELCSMHFRSLIDQKKEVQTSLSNNQQTFEGNTARLTALQKNLETLTEKLAALKQRYDQREELPDKATELEKVIRIFESQALVVKYDAALERGALKLKEHEAKLTATRTIRKEKEEEVEKLKAGLSDLTSLSLIKTWFATLDEIQEGKKQLMAEAVQLKGQIDTLHQNAALKLKDIPGILPEAADQPLAASQVRAALEQQLHRNRQEEEEVTAALVTARTQKELQVYAANLVDGAPCPLCGSVHHPSVLHADNSSDTLIKELLVRKSAIEKQENSIRLLSSDTERIFAQIETLEQQKNGFRLRNEEVKKRLDQHQQQFVWPDFDKNDRAGFEKHFSEVSVRQQAVRMGDAELKKLAEQVDQWVEEKTEKIEKPLQDLKNSRLVAVNTIETLTGQLERIEIAAFEQMDHEAIRAEAARLRAEYAELVKTFEQAQKDEDVLEKEKNVLSGSQDFLTKAIQSSREKEKELQERIAEQLVVHQLESEVQVVQVLARQIDTTAERAFIDAFNKKRTETSRDLALLQAENGNEQYEPEVHNALIAKVAGATEAVNSHQKEQGKLEASVQKLAEDLARKESLLDKRTKLGIRKQHLDDLARLFRSSGFVDYASSIYLNNLIQAANHRFHQMTHQQLHLELGEGNSFWVRDLLNGGHMRLLKTLSGGQKFQAALSLALALADHIHHRNKSSHNFFFLDEGFGSLDKNALQTVFETLKSLRKENRIVGIISHVEDLQQEIQTYLKIEESDEGSRIIKSWADSF